MTISSADRQTVRKRAEGRCEYCRRPDGTGKFSHQVDHIIPIKHQGSSDLNNLAWACFQCNTTKGSEVAAYDPDTGKLAPLFNPRTQIWNDHFEWAGALIFGRTPVGRATILALKLNHPNQVETRQNLIDTGRW